MAGIPLVGRRVLEGVLYHTGEAAVGHSSALQGGADTPETQLKLASFQLQLQQARAALEGQAMEGILWTSESPFVSQMQAFIARNAAAKQLERVDAAQEVPYDDGDWVNWARSFFDWWRRIEPAPFRQPSDPTRPQISTIPHDARIALFADWGSGRYGAPVIQKTIARAAGSVAAVIHLGDTYYAGTPQEMKANLLPTAKSR